MPIVFLQWLKNMALSVRYTVVVACHLQIQGGLRPRTGQLFASSASYVLGRLAVAKSLYMSCQGQARKALCCQRRSRIRAHTQRWRTLIMGALGHDNHCYHCEVL